MRAQPLSQPPTLKFERQLRDQGYRLVAGVDEVGRGSWAGPVVAAAVILPFELPGIRQALASVRDSKQLLPEDREKLSKRILRRSLAVGFGWATHHMVDSAGLTAANYRAMERALCKLRPIPEAVLVDGFRLSDCPFPQTRLIHGDSLSLSIACASIVAKVFRDRWMTHWHAHFPEYGFASHKGYGCPGHREALRQFGPSPLHRRSFLPVALSAS